VKADERDVPPSAQGRDGTGPSFGRPVAIEMRVPFFDIDGLGIVWHGNYFKYFDIARTELMRAHGLDVDALVGLKHRVMVIEAKCRYAYPLHYNDRFTVTARFTEIQNRIRIAYVLWNLDRDRRTAKAHTTLVTTDADGTMLWETPKAICDRIRG
jgi:acyl-CoA thioester hydrolase